MLKRWLLPLVMVLLFISACGTTMDSTDSEKEAEDRTEDIGTDIDESTNNTDRDEPSDNDPETDAEKGTAGTGNTETDKVKDSVQTPTNMIVHFIDVGQGDSILIEATSGNVLVDAGNWNGREVIDYLNIQGINHIDLMIATHPDADHIGQMPLILEALTVDEVWMNGIESTSKTFENTIKLILEKDIVYYEPEVGDGVDFGDVAIDVLGPISKTGDANRDSIVTQVTHGAVEVMLTGDAGVKEEASLINRFGNRLMSDILKLGHHGSNTSTSQAFLDAVNPEAVIISASENNSYGHPHEEVVERLVNAEVDVYQTSQHGDIVFLSDGATIELIDAKDYPTTPVVPTNESTTTNDQQDETTTPPVITPAPDVSKEETNPSSENSTCVDVNTASKEQLMTIIHIGDERADQLIQLRPFDSVDQLTRINGIAAGRLKDIKAENIACVR
ncbi:MBL fold metallo-hydrolase [Halolactibacillus halophilus]|uniref:MBL fold metallo-hydrolase n=1 Tax=Halolactibacillus halophilus TaxID=306540 RepID=UPI00135635E4|nr:MBL fold metallo-hydrolase [Halolactibacillus halophilus]